jgi:NAD(P)-dependent dehydrogenase (short-subunit alcohol dehydrogenase family)
MTTSSARFGLEGHVAVVTGVLGNLGPVWSRVLLGAGASVMGLDLPGAKPSPEFMSLQREYGTDRLAFADADVCDRAGLESVLALCVQRFGVPTVLVNNAGIDQPPDSGAARHRIEELPFEVSQRIFDVNVVGLFQAAQVFGGEMVKAGRGSIINIGSLYAAVSPDQRFYDHIPGDPPFLKPPAYGASKAAVVNLTKYLATLWGPRGVRVNALSPGGVLGDQDEHFKSKFCERVPLGRMAVDDDLAGPLLFLASGASSYVTGTELRVDGGFTAW